MGNSEYKTQLSKKNKTEKPQGHLKDCCVPGEGKQWQPGATEAKCRLQQCFSTIYSEGTVIVCFVFPNSSQIDGLIKYIKNELLEKEKTLNIIMQIRHFYDCSQQT